jgi:hypothetical protein
MKGKRREGREKSTKKVKGENCAAKFMHYRIQPFLWNGREEPLQTQLTVMCCHGNKKQILVRMLISTYRFGT